MFFDIGGQGGADEWHDLTLNAAGLAGINKSGFTMLGIKEEHDVINSDPGDAFEFTFDSSDKGGNDPYLAISYSTGGGGVMGFNDIHGSVFGRTLK